jgi:hypothetical protein
MSDDLNGYARCYCDANHRDEDFCGVGKVGSGICVSGATPGAFPQAFVDVLDDYYDDIYDEDCVNREASQQARRCRKGTYTKDLPPGQLCFCDSNHKNDINDLDDLEDCEYLADATGARGGSDDRVDEEFWVAAHYEWDENDVEEWCGDPATEQLNEDAGEDFEKFDPNCYERGAYGGYGGYGMGGGYGGYGGYGMGGGMGGYGGFNMGGGMGSSYNMGGAYNMGGGMGSMYNPGATQQQQTPLSLHSPTNLLSFNSGFSGSFGGPGSFNLAAPSYSFQQQRWGR